MGIIKFLLGSWDSILVVVGFVIFVVVLIKRGEIKILESILYRLVTQAEKELGTGTGSLKYATVSDWVYQRLPAILKFLFTAKDIDNLIEAALTEAKKKWESNESLKQYIETGETQQKLIG